MGHRRVLEVEMGRLPHDCIVRSRPPGAAFEILRSITGRAPVWIALRRGFGCQSRAAKDAVVAGERLGYDVVVTGPRAVVDEPAPEPAEPVVPGLDSTELAALW